MGNNISTGAKMNTTLAIIFFIFAEVAFAQSTAEIALIKKFVPTTFSQTKSTISGETFVWENGLGYVSATAELNGVGKGRFLVVLYQVGDAPGSIRCQLSVIKVVGNSGSLAGNTTLNYSRELANCTDVSVKDLDGDGKGEVLVTTTNMKAEENAPFVFKWNGVNLVDLTPMRTVQTFKVNNFRELSISDVKDGSSLLLVDYPLDGSTDTQVKLYSLKSGKINLLNAYPWYYLNQKTGSTPLLDSVTLSIPAGTYILEVKNRSVDQTKAIRAQVQVGSNIVIKPNDLCSGPAPKGYKPANDGDNNEDKNKGCVARKSTYATVTIKGNEVIKITGYGATGSYLELSLLKK